jgi:glyoxylase-like metal-dependent hydrolase (beta-lactamase superfamily II)
MPRLTGVPAALGILTTLAIAGAAGAQPPAPPAAPTRVIAKIRGDLYRFQNNTHNSWFLVTPEGVIVGDPINAEAAAWLKNEIAQRFKVPVRYLVYSHHHWDHASGAAVFNDTAELIGHANMPAALKDAVANLQTGQRLQDKNKNRRLDRDEATGGLVAAFQSLDRNGDNGLDGSEILGNVVAPESTYTDRRTITLGGKTVELIHPGPNHSDDATVVYFPAERVVYGVDWINVRTPPGGLLGDVTLAQWIAALRKVEAIDFELVAPGHGNIGTKADFVAYRQYFEDLVDAVSKGIAAGQTVEQLQASNILDQYAWWLNYPTARNTNIAQAYELLKGR